MNGQNTLEQLQADKKRLQEKGPTAATQGDLCRWSDVIREDARLTEHVDGDVVVMSGTDVKIVELAWELLDLAGVGETVPDDESGESIARIRVQLGEM